MRKGQQSAIVVRRGARTARVLVSQDDVDLVRAAHRARGSQACRPRRRHAAGARILREVPAASNALPNLALSSIGGGQVAARPARSEGAEDAQTPGSSSSSSCRRTQALVLGERVYVRFEHGSEPLAWRMLPLGAPALHEALRRLMARSPAPWSAAPIRSATSRARASSTALAHRARNYFAGHLSPGAPQLSAHRAGGRVGCHGLAQLSDEELRAARGALRPRCGAHGFDDSLGRRGFALVREAARRAPRHAPLRRAADRRLGDAAAACWPRWRPAKARRSPRRSPPRPRRSPAAPCTSSPSTTISPSATPSRWRRCTRRSASPSAA